MSKAYDPNLELDCLTVTHDTQAELKSETASAIDDLAIIEWHCVEFFDE